VIQVEAHGLDSRLGHVRRRLVDLLQLLLFWIYTVTILRALRRPSDWAEAHWLLSYRWGALKRGLVGAVVDPLLSYTPAARHVELTIALLATGVLATFFATLFWLGRRNIDPAKPSPDLALAMAVFFTSPYVVMAAHLNGYFDNILVLLAVASILLIARGMTVAAALVQVVAMLVHEAGFLMVFPVVVFASLLQVARRVEAGAGRDALVAAALKYLLPLALPLAAFAALVVGQSRLIRSESAEQRMVDHLSQYPFLLPRARNIKVPAAFANSYRYYLRTQSRSFWSRITDLGELARIGPTALLLVWHSARMLRPLRHGRALTLALLAATVAPLAIHAIAWDTPRIWTFPLVAAFLALSVVREATPAAELGRSLLFRCSCAITLIVNVFDHTELFDDFTERFSAGRRLEIYGLPVVLLIVVCFRMARRRAEPARIAA
jgi:hypothetical protein